MTMEVSTFEQLSRRMLEDARHTGRPERATPRRFSETRDPDTNDASDISRKSDDVQMENGTSAAAGQQHPPVVKSYGDQWEWSADDRDYVRVGSDGEKKYYTNYQRTGSRPLSPTNQDSDNNYTCDAEAKRASPKSRDASVPPRAVSSAAPDAPVPEAPAWKEDLEAGFQVVAKPKRFFVVGRIFKTVWFEPATADMLSRHCTSADAWPNQCVAFHGEKPLARFRWFIVVKRRPSHSLCLAITTFGGKSGGGGGGGSGTNPGRPMDFAVLHSASVEPARPYEEEGITRDPIAVIIEDEDQYISPIARLDFGRVYTVEDSLKTMKIGRVHPASLPLLDKYYLESVS